jgi:hypothetical protein
MSGTFAHLLYLTATILLSWLLMQAVHELGHVLAAWLTGGRVVEVDLHPLRISRTIVDPNPHPVMVVWSGPLLGSFFPLLLWWISLLRPSPLTDWLRFFAGFCLIANGAYLGAVVWMPVGDVLDLLRLGVPAWQLALFGLVAVSLGLWLWHRLGPQFGLGPDARPIPKRMFWGVISALGIVILLELAYAV